MLCLVAQLCLTLWGPTGYSPPGSSVLGILGFSRQDIRVGCHALLQGSFPTQGSNPRLLQLLHCRQILLPLSYRGSPSVTYMYILFHILFHYGLSQGIYHRFPVPYSRTLLFIHSIYNGLHLLIPNTWSIPAPSLSCLGINKPLFCVCDSVSAL